MSPAALTPEPTFHVLPLIKRKEQKFNFGAVVECLDLNDISGMLPSFGALIAGLQVKITTLKG
jgi:hypothetical protein